MPGSPARNEAAEYYFTYIDKARTDDIMDFIDSQSDMFRELLNDISDEFRALAFIIAGHVEHHRRLFVERYF